MEHDYSQYYRRYQLQVRQVILLFVLVGTLFISSCRQGEILINVVVSPPSAREGEIVSAIITVTEDGKPVKGKAIFVTSDGGLQKWGTANTNTDSNGVLIVHFKTYYRGMPIAPGLGLILPTKKEYVYAQYKGQSASNYVTIGD